MRAIIFEIYNKLNYSVNYSLNEYIDTKKIKDYSDASFKSNLPEINEAIKNLNKQEQNLKDIKQIMFTIRLKANNTISIPTEDEIRKLAEKLQVVVKAYKQCIEEIQNSLSRQPRNDHNIKTNEIIKSDMVRLNDWLTMVRSMSVKLSAQDIIEKIKKLELDKSSKASYDYRDHIEGKFKKSLAMQKANIAHFIIDIGLMESYIDRKEKKNKSKGLDSSEENNLKIISNLCKETRKVFDKKIDGQKETFTTQEMFKLELAYNLALANQKGNSGSYLFERMGQTLKLLKNEMKVYTKKEANTVDPYMNLNDIMSNLHSLKKNTHVTYMNSREAGNAKQNVFNILANLDTLKVGNELNKETIEKVRKIFKEGDCSKADYREINKIVTETMSVVISKKLTETPNVNANVVAKPTPIVDMATVKQVASAPILHAHTKNVAATAAAQSAVPDSGIHNKSHKPH